MKYRTLTREDLVPDEPLDRMVPGVPIPDELDSLNHRATAQRVAELALATTGHLNIALFGPWGSGKSSFFGLVKDQIRRSSSDVVAIRFDAWKNSGPNFQTNFLSAVAADIPGADKGIASRLFKTSSSIELPFGITFADVKGRTRLVLTALISVLVIFGALPALWTWALVSLDSTQSYPALLAANLTGWVGFAAGGSLLFLVATIFLELSKVTVHESTPSHIAQFGALFSELMESDKRRYVIFIDELDRCSPADVIQTLEGLRTFLGHEKCVFIVAFDREAVSATITQHLPNDVPMRPSRPYYSTSGEYLDKIFQFQVSLPPQASHTFRRFALSLVRTRGGVWSELRATSPRLLERVVRILSPMHVTSPRRTKVLLNDFAMNARILERLEFKWIERAEEIAALTVLQTEFPNFTADLEEQPQLLRYVASQQRPAREPIASMFESYIDGSHVELDGVVKGGIDDEVEAEDNASPESTSDPNDSGDVVLSGDQSVALQLNRNLHRFLRKMGDMGVTLPLPDLVLMHSDSNLLSFEDLNVYNALLAATDEPRADTLSILSGASESDRARSLSYLLEQAELETSDEAETLVVLAGEVADGLAPEVSARESDAMHDAWKQVAETVPRAVSRFSSASLAGFTRAFSARLSPTDLQAFHAIVRTNKPNDHAAVVENSIENIPDESFAAHAPYLGRAAIAFAVQAPLVMQAYLQVRDRLEMPGLSEKDITSLAAQFAVEKPEEITATTATAAARALATEQNEAAGLVYEESIGRSKDALGELAALLGTLKVEGATRASMLDAMRKIGLRHRWAYDLHDEAIEDAISRGLESVANNELLLAIPTSVFRSRDNWIPMLTRTAEVEGASLERAILGAVSGKRKQEIDVRLVAAENAVAIAGLPHTPAGVSDDLLLDARSFLDEEWAATDIKSHFMLVGSVITAADLLHETNTAERTLAAPLVTKAVSVVDESDDYDFLIQYVAGVDAETASLIAVSLQGLINDSEESQLVPLLRVLLTAHQRMIEAGLETKAVPGDVVALGMAHEPPFDQVDEWIQTGPSLTDLLGSKVDLDSVSAGTWRVYSRRVGVDAREGLWVELDKSKFEASALAAVASEGVSDAFYSGRVEQVLTAKTGATKGAAVAKFRSLPQGGKAAARGAVQIATHLTSGGDGNKTDAPLVVAVLLENAGAMSREQRAAFNDVLGRWLDAAQGYVAKRDIAKLTELGFVERDDSFLGKLGRALSAGRATLGP